MKIFEKFKKREEWKAPVNFQENPQLDNFITDILRLYEHRMVLYHDGVAVQPGPIVWFDKELEKEFNETNGKIEEFENNKELTEQLWAYLKPYVNNPDLNLPDYRREMARVLTGIFKKKESKV